ncbi:MAG: recombinase family protein [Clostridia bacterium]|nr:recombinase family protein [Clostridia bacterium]
MQNVEVIKAQNTLSPRSRTNLTNRIRVAAYCRVSTDSEDQLHSYKSQVSYYSAMIQEKSEWSYAGIYADEGITGTQVAKREDFQRMINDCMSGKIDMVITKSISRFARNTLDTLKYVRQLKEKGVAVFFEEEHINTLTMDGELMLVILSSVAQQEVENISANVKKGLKMKMQRGEMVGFSSCLGYTYNPDTKNLVIHPEEAEIVRYIFRRYIDGAGCRVIANELQNLGYKTKRGNANWSEGSVMKILKNEKYIGDIRMGKTYTLDPISKRRMNNFGEEDQFYVRDHHEPIISKETYQQAHEVLSRRSSPLNSGKHAPRNKFSRQYTFSCLLKCGFCGSNLSRRTWHSGTPHSKIIWQCVASTKKGKSFCPHSKGITEECIENAFLESYRLLSQNHQDVMDEFFARAERALTADISGESMHKIQSRIYNLQARQTKLIDMHLDNLLDKETFVKKNQKLTDQLRDLQAELLACENVQSMKKETHSRMVALKNKLDLNEVLHTFDRKIFETLVDYVIVGCSNPEGNMDPYKLTFVYKTKTSDTGSPTITLPQQDETASQPTSELMEILCFRHFIRHTVFDSITDISRSKRTENSILVSVAVNM